MNQPNMVCEKMSCGASKNIFYICPIDLDVVYSVLSLFNRLGFLYKKFENFDLTHISNDK
jgi:hypothetical protein